MNQPVTNNRSVIGLFVSMCGVLGVSAEAMELNVSYDEMAALLNADYAATNNDLVMDSMFKRGAEVIAAHLDESADDINQWFEDMTDYGWSVHPVHPHMITIERLMGILTAMGTTIETINVARSALHV
jgi:hypothetical protein